MRRNARQETYTLKNGRLVHPKPKVARARHKGAQAARAQLGELLGGLNGHANGQANGTPAAEAKGRGGRKKQPPSTIVATVAAPAALPTPAAPVPEAQPSNHGAGGRFVAGNTAAAGNPFHRAVAARRKALLDAITAEDVAAVAKKLHTQAVAGDVTAAKVLLAYVVGKPAPAADPDRLALDELSLLLERPFAVQLLLHALEGVDSAFAVAFLRELEARKPVDPLARLDTGRAKALLALREKAVETRATQT